MEGTKVRTMNPPEFSKIVFLIPLLFFVSRSFAATLSLAGSPKDEKLWIVALKSKDAKILSHVDRAHHRMPVKIAFPSGPKKMIFTATADKSLFYAVVASAAFHENDLALEDGAGVNLSFETADGKGASTFTADYKKNIIYPFLGGKVETGGAQVIVQPGEVKDEMTAGIETMGTENNQRRSSLTKKGWASLGKDREVRFEPAGAVKKAALSLPVEKSLVPQNSDLNRAKIARYNPRMGEWEIQRKTVLKGNLLVCDISRSSIYKPVLASSETDDAPAQVHVFQNPSDPGEIKIRGILGEVDSIQVTILNSSGTVVYRSKIPSEPTGIFNNQYFYDFNWSGAKPRESYSVQMEGKRSDGTHITAKTKFGTSKQ